MKEKIIYKEKIKYVDGETGETFDEASDMADIINLRKKEKTENENYNNANKNPDFIQFTRHIAPSLMAKICIENGNAGALMMFFMENMNNTNAVVVSQKVIASMTGISQRSITRAIKVLEDNKAIAIGKVGGSNIYIVNPDVAWTRGSKYRNTVSIQAKVLLGEDENKRIFQEFGEVHKIVKENNLTMDSVNTKNLRSSKERQYIVPEEQRVGYKPKEEEYEEDYLSPEERDIENISEGF